ncbi:MAG: demethoxyubiquinone hydroxylase family protein [Alphaproteobacteria bacterium]|jgi:ubiquinone biosynthesis monooxygenase Coq7|nr:demethoxyubiquinone hydroxylase family protein [Alphaproteobacteria bacterium]
MNGARNRRASEQAGPATEPALPGELSGAPMLERMIRVDHAGEYGARRIYEGQLAVLGRSDKAAILQHMAEQERVHLATFERLVVERRVRPSLLQPVWHVAGFALGAGTALLGERAAMACTVAVEEVIDEHYARQARQLGPEESELRETIDRFRAEELEHRDIGLENEAEQAPGYRVLSAAIKGGSRVAIWLAERF